MVQNTQIGIVNSQQTINSRLEYSASVSRSTEIKPHVLDGCAPPAVGVTWGDGADHHRFLAARHEAEAQHWVSPHLHQARGGGHAVQVDLLQGAALRHLTGGAENETMTKTSFLT